MFVVKSAQLDYQVPARLDDELMLTLELERLGKASLVCLQKAWLGEQCLNEGRFKIGCVNIQTLRPYPIPASVFALLKNVNLS
jgi:acyl-CoA thioester hydrolase